MAKKTVERSIFDKIHNIKLGDNFYSFMIENTRYLINCNKNQFFSDLAGYSRFTGYKHSEKYIEKKVSVGATDKHGGYYLAISIKSKTLRLHRLIAYLKYGDDIFSNEVDHVDGNRKNNKPSNLIVCTRQENAKNAKDRGAFDGVGSFKGKLKKKDLKDIVNMLKQGISNTEIAALYKVDKSCISLIKNNKWKGLKYV